MAAPGAPAPPAPCGHIIGPQLTLVGQVKRFGDKFGFLTTESFPGTDIIFSRPCIVPIPGEPPAEPQQGCCAAFDMEAGPKGQRAKQVVLLTRMNPNEPVYIGRVKSFNPDGKAFGFINPYENAEQDYHFSIAQVHGLVPFIRPGRICAFQVDKSATKGKCIAVTPFIDQSEAGGAPVPPPPAPRGAAPPPPSVVHGGRGGRGGPPALLQLAPPPHVMPRRAPLPPQQYGAQTSPFHVLVDLEVLGYSPDVIQRPEVQQAAAQGAAEHVTRVVQQMMGVHPSAGYAGGAGHSAGPPPPPPAPLPPAPKRPRGDPLSAAELGATQSGTVKSWGKNTNYGFIVPADGSGDVRVSKDQIAESFGGELTPGAEVYFTLDPQSTTTRKRASFVSDPANPESGLASGAGPASPQQPAATQPQIPETPLPQGGDPEGGGQTGTVKSYNPEKGFGFILCDTTGQDIHIKAETLTAAGLSSGYDIKGTRLGFSLISGKTRAAQVWAV